MSAQQLLRVEGVSKSFAGVHALHEVSLAIEAGEIVCLAGENGSGKSNSRQDFSPAWWRRT